MRKKWTRGEKFLWAAPLFVAIFAAGALWGPKIARRRLGLPTKIETSARAALRGIALSADGSTLAATGYSKGNNPHNGEIQFWDARTLQPKPTLPALPPAIGREENISNGLALSPDGKTLVFAQTGAPFRAFDSKTQRLKWAAGRRIYFGQSHFSPDGKFLGLSGAIINGTCSIWRVADGRLQNQWRVNIFDDETSFSWAPDGKTIACIGPRRQIAGDDPNKKWELSGGRDIEIRRVSDGKLLQTLISPRTLSLEFAPDGKKIVAVFQPEKSLDGIIILGTRVICFSLATGRALWTFGAPSKEQFRDAQFSPDGKTIAAYQTSTPRIALLDAQTGALQRTLQLNEEATVAMAPNALAWAPDGKRLFARGKTSVLVWELD